MPKFISCLNYFINCTVCVCLFIYILIDSFMYLFIYYFSPQRTNWTSAERALMVWPSLLLYINAVKRSQTLEQHPSIHGSGPEGFTNLSKAAVFHDCCQDLQSLFEEVPDRWVNDAFPWQRLGKHKENHLHLLSPMLPAVVMSEVPW